MLYSIFHTAIPCRKADSHKLLNQSLWIWKHHSSGIHQVSQPWKDSAPTSCQIHWPSITCKRLQESESMPPGVPQSYLIYQVYSKISCLLHLSFGSLWSWLQFEHSHRYPMALFPSNWFGRSVLSFSRTEYLPADHSTSISRSLHLSFRFHRHALETALSIWVHTLVKTLWLSRLLQTHNYWTFGCLCTELGICAWAKHRYRPTLCK